MGLWRLEEYPSNCHTPPFSCIFREENTTNAYRKQLSVDFKMIIGREKKMAFRYLGPDRIEEQLKAVLVAIEEGNAPRDIELKNIDVKEEPNRRDKSGNVLPGEIQNESAAQYLARELACLANTEGAGAIILGISDDGARIGTNLDAEWLRHRIYQISERRLTVDVKVGSLDDARLLIVRAPEAIEPVRWKGRILWRVADNCVEVDPNTWMDGRLHRIGFDWSAQGSGYTISDAKSVALEVARSFLEQAGDNTSLDLARATDADLLRRLNVVKDGEHLTNAGSLLFVATPEAGIDYIRRDYPGGDSTFRVRPSGPLLTQLAKVEQAAMSSNPVVHVPAGLAHAQVRSLPQIALREAIVNGIVHRDWLTPAPTVVEHIGNTLTVTSPGGFIAGVSPTNIITHPSAPRYRSLATVVSALRLSEQEGIGVDRMVAEMLALGYSKPEITEIEGPYVRAALIGGTPDQEWLRFMNAAEPKSINRDVDSLLLLDMLMEEGWFDAARAAPVLQRSLAETRESIDRLAQATLSNQPILTLVSGTPPEDDPAWRLSDAARAALQSRVGTHLDGAGRLRLILRWAVGRGRVSSSEASDISGVSQNYANTLLQKLEEDGLLDPSRPQRRGRGFFYRPSQQAQDSTLT